MKCIGCFGADLPGGVKVIQCSILIDSACRVRVVVGETFVHMAVVNDRPGRGGIGSLALRLRSFFSLAAFLGLSLLFGAAKFFCLLLEGSSLLPSFLSGGSFNSLPSLVSNLQRENTGR